MTTDGTPFAGLQEDDGNGVPVSDNSKGADGGDASASDNSARAPGDASPPAKPGASGTYAPTPLDPKIRPTVISGFGRFAGLPLRVAAFAMDNRALKDVATEAKDDLGQAWVELGEAFGWFKDVEDPRMAAVMGMVAVYGAVLEEAASREPIPYRKKKKPAPAAPGGAGA